jgi:hypothetical protein
MDRFSSWRAVSIAVPSARSIARITGLTEFVSSIANAIAAIGVRIPAASIAAEPIIA